VNQASHLSERMVDVSRGRSSWTPLEAAHLRDCAECAAEWRLICAAASIGGSVDIDSERIAHAVVGRLAAQRRGSSVARRASWLVGLAAAASLAIVSLLPDSNGAPAPASTTAPVLSELDDLTSEELLTVLDVLDPSPVDAGSDPDAARLGDLTTGELERVLRSLEG